LKVSCQGGGNPEIFHTLQGEGPSIGTPAVFLRLALCNLACTWCDTKYTWDWDHYDYQKEVVELSVDDVESRILEYGCPHLVITGGEPMLQQDTLAQLVRSLKNRGFTFEVETNGTIEPVPDLVQDIDQWNVSPKLETSGNPTEQRQVPATLACFVDLPRAYFKFVVARDSDIQEVNRLAQDFRIPRDRVLLSPEGRTPDVLANRSSWLSRVCVDEGLRFSPRLHILLWGDTRGT
jgi:7-cyano-7-deazaguanosine (preQ0) biosynthesis protein QueE